MFVKHIIKTLHVSVTIVWPSSGGRLSCLVLLLPFLLICVVKLFVWYMAVRCLCVCVPYVLVCEMSGCELFTVYLVCGCMLSMCVRVWCTCLWDVWLWTVDSWEVAASGWLIQLEKKKLPPCFSIAVGKPGNMSQEGWPSCSATYAKMSSSHGRNVCPLYTVANLQNVPCSETHVKLSVCLLLCMSCSSCKYFLLRSSWYILRIASAWRLASSSSDSASLASERTGLR